MPPIALTVVTHSLTPFQPLLTCVCGIYVCLHVCEACVLLRAWTLTSIDTCRDTRMQWIALARTHARACIGHPSVRLLLHLLDATHALMLIRHHANRHHVLLARLCHVRSAMCPTQVPSGVPSDLARCDRAARLSAKRAKLDDESAARESEEELSSCSNNESTTNCSRQASEATSGALSHLYWASTPSWR